MKKLKKRYLFIFSLFLLIVIAGIIFIFLPKTPVIHPTVNVFGAPGSQNKLTFPADNPQFNAVIGKIKPATVHQQSIVIYKLGSKQKVFERNFYDDSFRGSELGYTLSSNSAEITQSGSIGSLGCSDMHCSLLWSNYYTWDPTAQTFVLTNTGHTTEFKYLLSSYQTVDQKGCGIVAGAILPDQSNLSFTELVKKFPTAKFYCSNQQGILPGNIMFFLQAERVLTEIVNGENIGSNDIRDIQL